MTQAYSSQPAEANLCSIPQLLKTLLTRMFDTCHNVAKREVAMKSMSSREVIKLIEQDGWYLVAVAGSHHQFKHLTKPGKVTIPHPKTRLAPKTVSSILKQAGLL